MYNDEDIIDMLKDLFEYDEAEALKTLESAKANESKYEALMTSYTIYIAMKRLPNAKEELQKTRDMIRAKKPEVPKSHKNISKKPISQYNIN